MLPDEKSYGCRIVKMKPQVHGLITGGYLPWYFCARIQPKKTKLRLTVLPQVHDLPDIGHSPIHVMFEIEYPEMAKKELVLGHCGIPTFISNN